VIHGKRVVVVMPAYNAAATVERTFHELPHDVVDRVILTDDASSDATVEVSRRLGIETLVHDRNQGYGGNQKTCYAAALAAEAGIVVMVHPDYQYTPRLVAAMASLIANDVYDVVLGSRILGRGALAGGMPRYKYLGNRALTLVENWMVGHKLSEYHTGYRAFSRRVLESLPLLECSDDFVFDNQMLLQALFFGFRVGEVSCPTRYAPDSSSIDFRRSVVYGFGVLATGALYWLARRGLSRPAVFSAAGRRLDPAPSRLDQEPGLLA
jgi:glycosyltransferase involved in cell wall biosynthesis